MNKKIIVFTLRILSAILFIFVPHFSNELLINIMQTGATGDYFTALIILTTIGMWLSILFINYAVQDILKN